MEPEVQAVAEALASAGAVFAFVHGSRARGDFRPDSDLDIAAWWGSDAPTPWDVDLPSGVDLLVLDGAPLELAGRIAVEGVLVLDRDEAARVTWVATTRKIWFDESPRFTRAHQEFAEVLRHGR